MFGFDSYSPSKWVEGVVTVHVQSPLRKQEKFRRSNFRRGTWLSKGSGLAVALLLGCAIVTKVSVANANSTESHWPAGGQVLDDSIIDQTLHLGRAVTSLEVNKSQKLITQLRSSLALLRMQIESGDRSALRQSLMPLATEIAAEGDAYQISSPGEWANALVSRK